MKISVIMACKNEKNTIEKAIESVLFQTYKNFEIIVVDGHSTDGTLELLKKYSDYVKIFPEREKGIYQAMNYGIELADGDIFYFLNANDSIFNENVFERVMKCFDETNADFIYGDTNFQSRGKNGETVDSIVSHKDFYSKFVWAYRNLNHQSTFYKKELFEKYGNYDCKNFEILADVELTTKVSVQKGVKIFYLPIVIANYNSEGVSSYNNPENIKKARIEKETIVKTYLPFENKLFKVYDFVFAPLIGERANNFIKKRFGLKVLFKIRDFKRAIGRIFFWWWRRIKVNR